MKINLSMMHKLVFVQDEKVESVSELPCVTTTAEDVAQFLNLSNRLNRAISVLNGLDDIYQAQRSQILLINLLSTAEVIKKNNSSRCWKVLNSPQNQLQKLRSKRKGYGSQNQRNFRPRPENSIGKEQLKLRSKTLRNLQENSSYYFNLEPAQVAIQELNLVKK
ncbi:LOW QUALITY PROTEIN: hypothetical protein Cgig2_006814 [Carnegiea gigantea]|uniref:Uncharacterized protein n=1 Tax=Carnegiea gigantea TaxID=171969 RepID=A0A9Q1JPN1_9CARY|nr:LOW QUALITY PROTEIN: hypothetical protein Cgig2_006814 [Carnegiea gigantea]